MGSVSLTASKVTQRRGFGPLVPGVTHIDYADCRNCPQNLNYGTCGTECVATIENKLFRRLMAPEEVAAIFVEPIQGEGGYIVPPPEFHRDLKALTKKHGILFVADEVQSGMGRTGKMCAIEHWDVEPDILCFAKGIASGLPLGAIVARADVMDWPPGAHASTFGGNPVACAAALETIALIEEELMANATRVGDFLFGKLKSLQTRHAEIGDVRGKGLMLAIEMVKPGAGQSPDPDAPDPDAAEQLVQTCFQKGLLLLRCGESAVRLCPPLVITQEHAEIALSIIEESLVELEKGTARRTKGVPTAAESKQAIG
jgi:4-aminobutyrate aminotransferase